MTNEQKHTELAPLLTELTIELNKHPIVNISAVVTLGDKIKTIKELCETD